MKNLQSKALHLTLAALVAVLWGCGSGNGINSQSEAKRVEYAKSLRSYFDKAQGDYSKLDETDKAAFIKLSGSETKADQNWTLMKNGPGAIDRNASSAAGQ